MNATFLITASTVRLRTPHYVVVFHPFVVMIDLDIFQLYDPINIQSILHLTFLNFNTFYQFWTAERLSRLKHDLNHKNIDYKFIRSEYLKILCK